MPFVNGAHDLNASQGTTGGPKGLKAQHRSDQLFHCSMILFHRIVQILALADDNPGMVDPAVSLNRSGVARTLINRDRLREPVLTNRLAQKAAAAARSRVGVNRKSTV